MCEKRSAGILTIILILTFIHPHPLVFLLIIIITTILIIIILMSHLSLRKSILVHGPTTKRISQTRPRSDSLLTSKPSLCTHHVPITLLRVLMLAVTFPKRLHPGIDSILAILREQRSTAKHSRTAKTPSVVGFTIQFRLDFSAAMGNHLFNLQTVRDHVQLGECLLLAHCQTVLHSVLAWIREKL